MSIITRLTTLVAVATASSVSTGCGSLDGHTSSPTTLATVQGALTNEKTIAVAAPIRVAVVWAAPLARGSFQYAEVAEDLPVQPIFPAGFSIQLDRPPPSAALIHPTAADAADAGVSPDAAAAVGVVVAYEDRNGNGKLDLVPEDASAFVDRIVGINPDRAVGWGQGFSGTWSNLNGYYLVETTCPNYDGTYLTLPDGGYCDWSVSVPIDTPYELAMTDDPAWNRYMCETFDNNATGVCGALLGAAKYGPF